MTSADGAYARRFRVVARERMAKIRAHVETLLTDAGTDHEVGELRREVHSLKGEARVVGFPAVAQSLHAIEEMLSGERARAASAELFLQLPIELDAIEDLLEEREEEEGSATARAPDALLERLARHTNESFLRVDLGSLSLLSRAMGEVRVFEAELSRFVDDLARLAERAREEQRRDRSAVSNDLAVPLRQLAARARQLAFDRQARLTRLEDRVRAVRMVQLATLFEPFPRAARQLAAELGKEVEIAVSGANIEVDRLVLDVIAEPLLHLVRNAIDHGIEAPAERRACGKPAHGTLSLRARTPGSSVILEIEDDGRGIDVDVLSAALRERGEVDVDPTTLDDAGLLELLCRHGLSTRADISEVSGRGIGLDVVKRRTESVGGRLGMRSAVGVGTTFTLEVPISAVLATMVSALADGARYAFSPHDVDTFVDLADAQLDHAGTGLVLRVDDRPVPYFDLAALVGGRVHDSSARAAAVVLGHRGRRIAIGVDRLMGAQPVLQQRLDPFVERSAVLRSLALFADGELAVVLDVAELFHRAETGAALAIHASPSASLPRVHRVLVVDDSELTRDVVVSLLREMGLEAIEAVNGQVASELLAATDPDLVLTDLDMPVVDGFELLRRIRATPGREAMPVVVLSTRGSREDVQRASELGADAYLVKNRLEIEQLRRVISAQLQVRAT